MSNIEIFRVEDEYMYVPSIFWPSIPRLPFYPQYQNQLHCPAGVRADKHIYSPCTKSLPTKITLSSTWITPKGLLGCHWWIE